MTAIEIRILAGIGIGIGIAIVVGTGIVGLARKPVTEMLIRGRAAECEYSAPSAVVFAWSDCDCDYGYGASVSVSVVSCAGERSAAIERRSPRGETAGAVTA